MSEKPKSGRPANPMHELREGRLGRELPWMNPRGAQIDACHPPGSADGRCMFLELQERP